MKSRYSIANVKPAVKCHQAKFSHLKIEVNHLGTQLANLPAQASGDVPTDLSWSRILALCLYVLTIAPLIGTASSAAAEYHGAGYADYMLSVPDTNHVVRTITKMHWDFVFEASNDLWCIHLSDLADGIKMDYSYDGTNTYVGMPVILPTGSNISAQIFPIQYPPPNGYPAIAVWFAYCSGAYLNSVTNNMLCSLSQEGHPYITAYGRPMRSELEYLDTTLHIPRKCVEFSDGALYGIDVNKRPPAVINHRYGGAFSNGFVETAYSVGGTTNVGGLTLPKVFQLQQFRPIEGSPSSNDVFVISEFSGCLQSVGLGSSDIGNGVQARQNAIVSDYRGMKLDPPVELIQYISPSNSWLPFSPDMTIYAQ